MGLSFLKHKSKKHEDSFLGSFGYSHNTKDAKSSGKKSTKLDTKKSRRKNVTMSPTKYLSKIPKLSVKLDMKRDAKTNGSVLTIPNKKTLITAKTKNGNQPTKDARVFM